MHLDIPSAEAWGKKKGIYYNTDYIDKDFRKYSQEDEEMALAEEEEALQTQNRILSEINDTDLGFELYEKSDEKETELDTIQKLEVNLSTLSTREKLKLLQKTSPELIPLIEDFKKYLSEIKNIEPILKLSTHEEFKDIKNSTGFELLEIKFNLILRYAMNISFYMVLRCKSANVKNHPIINRLLMYKKLLQEIEKIETESKIHRELKEIEKKLSNGEKLKFGKRDRNADTPKKRVSITKPSAEEAIPLKKVKFNDQIITNEIEEEEELENEEELDADVATKRGITYEMAKNKGLTPKKKKKARNPRVKHREKYRKAIIRRKGQVRQPRKEIRKYSGEISGIRSTVVKSVKFK
ncbi:something about silencing protein 10-like protein [Dinothrombium tinctorium]|uniref:Something about silencing protein 10-like protein n=1 Tax=Dinothrombium tinctorium TaxID=1965070 RepID=A0A443QS66_9ACAR|nr:something about silencing protein 10-like protein [Dinothrombium tinctorium]